MKVAQISSNKKLYKWMCEYQAGGNCSSTGKHSTRPDYCAAR